LIEYFLLGTEKYWKINELH